MVFYFFFFSEIEHEFTFHRFRFQLNFFFVLKKKKPPRRIIYVKKKNVLLPHFQFSSIDTCLPRPGNPSLFYYNILWEIYWKYRISQIVPQLHAGKRRKEKKSIIIEYFAMCAGVYNTSSWIKTCTRWKLSGVSVVRRKISFICSYPGPFSYESTGLSFIYITITVKCVCAVWVQMNFTCAKLFFFFWAWRKIR